jgi:hypothetical protein
VVGAEVAPWAGGRARHGVGGRTRRGEAGAGALPARWRRVQISPGTAMPGPKSRGEAGAGSRARAVKLACTATAGPDPAPLLPQRRLPLPSSSMLAATPFFLKLLLGRRRGGPAAGRGEERAALGSAAFCVGLLRPLLEK